MNYNSAKGILGQPNHVLSLDLPEYRSRFITSLRPTELHSTTRKPD